MNNSDETERLVNDNTIHNIRSNSQPIPANRLALDAQIQATVEYQRRLRQRRRIYYIVIITSLTMTILFILSFVAWIIHSSSGASVNTFEVIDVNTQSNLPESSNPSTLSKFPKLQARKHPTRTTPESESIVLQKRSLGLDSDEEEKDEITVKTRREKRNPTRTRKLSFAPEKIIDYKPQFRPV